jgi:hypothetical protein
MVSCSKGVCVSKLKRSFVFLIVVMGLLATSGIALAGHEDTHAEDTQFSFGYDDVNHILSLNIGPNWDPYVCDFENEMQPLNVEYGDPDTDTGIIAITDLLDGATTKRFIARTDGLLEDAEVATPDPAPYSSGDEGVCGLTGVVVAGPNGQINHGQFMKAAKSLFSGKGNGCVVRYLAQSDIGRTDATRVRVFDVDPLFEVGKSGEVSFSTFEADCERGKKTADADGESTSGGRPESPGKSADAPGKNKPSP